MIFIPTTNAQPQSLRYRFKRLAIRWSLAGAFFSLVLILPILVYAVKHSSERQIEVMANSLTRAFRPMILEGYIRDTIPQIEEVAGLKNHESVQIVDPSYKPILNSGLSEISPSHCAKASVSCWLNGFRTISISQPIYFDTNSKSELYGYLILKMKPTVDWTEVFLILCGAIIVLIFQVKGLYSTLKKEALHISDVLSIWKERVDSPKHQSENDIWLFSEFEPLDYSIKGLHGKIKELEDTAALNAKTDVVRGIGHDLKTPLSQLSKFIEIFIYNTKKNQEVSPAEVDRINCVLKRMGNLIRQVTHLDKKPSSDAKLDLNASLESYLRDLNKLYENDPNFVPLEVERNFNTTPLIQADETDLFRIIDNIVKNSLEAFPEERTGTEKIKISISEEKESFHLDISDNGSGIPEHIQNRIFDLDFTTKQSRGTGLGLGIVKKICIDHGLRLNFQSKIGQGTTFNIAFPKGVSTE